ncbi:hypothetical protein COEREDRAFT_82506 [Coemansia reversa NRRL 1564]|uniref:Uncharacterized protein n=1 Tax=Coemansia reversa (strain ATCC 12441 / NRRL 1564) TaxID=763665 RepID=A0A2G5B6X8_COERN|nr:hypothetical protein COEREDRAFT_82506 [Coemansia reversa NRRL 1564]|eukprot:PIA14751.1 hypothetical protein COEREDRAFT_82506 [Coemansia reversa NRRL 1564]
MQISLVAFLLAASAFAQVQPADVAPSPGAVAGAAPEPAPAVPVPGATEGVVPGTDVNDINNFVHEFQEGAASPLPVAEQQVQQAVGSTNNDEAQSAHAEDEANAENASEFQGSLAGAPTGDEKAALPTPEQDNSAWASASPLSDESSESAGESTTDEDLDELESLSDDLNSLDGSDEDSDEDSQDDSDSEDSEDSEESDDFDSTDKDSEDSEDSDSLDSDESDDDTFDDSFTDDYSGAAKLSLGGRVDAILCLAGFVGAAALF